MWPKLPTPTISPGGAGGRASCAATEPKKSAAIDADTSAVTNLNMAAPSDVVIRRSAPTRNTTPAALGLTAARRGNQNGPRRSPKSTNEATRKASGTRPLAALHRRAARARRVERPRVRAADAAEPD